MIARTAALGALLGLSLGCQEEGGAIDVRAALRGPGLVDFGDLPIGFAAVRDVEIANLGTGPATLVAAEVTASAATHALRIVSDVADASVPPATAYPLRLELRTLDVSDEPVESTVRLTARLGPGETFDLEVRVRARGVERGLVARPNPVDFGRVRIGSTVRRQVEVINLLSEPVDVYSAFSASQAQLDDGAAFFSVVTPVDPRRDGSLLEEGERLRPGERTLVEVEYRPQSTSVDELNTGAWTLRSCEDSLCETTLELRGRGARNLLTCEPSPVNFGTVQPELVVDAFVRCRNTANVDLDVEGWELADFSDVEFSVAEPVGFPRRVAPGDSFEVAVRFTGATLELGGLSEGAVDVSARTATDRAAADAEIPLVGTSGGPRILVGDALDFGSVLVGRIGGGALDIANTGFADLEFIRFDIVGPDAAAFSVVGAAPDVISEGLDRRIPFQFEAVEERDYRATLVVETNDPLRPVVEVALLGAGVDLGPCEFELLPERLTFGTIPALAIARRPVTFDNVGSETCLLREARIENDVDAVFGLVDPPNPSVLVPPGARQLIEVSFRPRTEDESDAELILEVSGGLQRVELEGVGGLGDLIAAPTVVDFGTIRLGCQARSRVVSLTNVGGSPAAISQFDLRSREPEGVFALRGLPGGLPPAPGEARPIAAGQTFEFIVEFRPEAPRPALADLVIRLQQRPETYVVPIVGDASDAPTRVDSYTQSDGNRVDVLWVIDNSNSMNLVLDLVSITAEEIFDVLGEADIDYQTALVTTDVLGTTMNPCNPLRSEPQPGWVRGSCGFFSDGDDLVQRPDWRIVTERTRPSPERAFQGLVDVPRGGAAVESGLEAMRLALTPPRVEGWNRDFLRQDADLAVIIISNEEDQGPGSVPFYASLVSALKGLAGRRATINAVVPPVICLPGSIEAGRCVPLGPERYAEAALRTGGIVENIGVTDGAPIDVQAAEFADKLFNVVFSSTSLRALFPLSEFPAPGTIEVRIDGGPLDPTSPAGGQNWSYEPQGNRIRFTDRGRPPPGSNVEIEYQTFCF